MRPLAIAFLMGAVAGAIAGLATAFLGLLWLSELDDEAAAGDTYEPADDPRAWRDRYIDDLEGTLAGNEP